jgi:predicted dehydrogenase
MECVKLGIIGIGTMGSVHAQTIMEGKVARCKLTAVCDPKPERLKRFSSPDAFYSVEDLLRSSETDAVLIATPQEASDDMGRSFR